MGIAVPPLRQRPSRTRRPDVDLPRSFTIRESSHRIHNPFTSDKLATLGQALSPPPGTRMLVACHDHGTFLRGFLPRGWDHLVASDGTARRVVPGVLAAFLFGCLQVVGLGGSGGWCSGRSA